MSTYSFSDYDFIFDEGGGQKIKNKNNTDSLFNPIPPSMSGYTVIFKDKSANNTSGIINHLKTKVNAVESGNPYTGLIKEFSNRYSLRLRPSDFAYLTDFGVYPINKLWILRRFGEGVIVPNNLDELDNNIGNLAKSTVVGWMTDPDLLSLKFNEVWVNEDKMLHDLLAEIMNNEFNIKPATFVPVPAFSRGLLMAFLAEMNLAGSSETTDWGIDEIPVGNPNVIKSAIRREIDGPGLASELTLTLKTSYEMKMIGDVDPGSAMLDIIENLIYMGTSNSKFILDKNSAVLNSLRKAVNSNGNKANSPSAWLEFIITLIKAFFRAIMSVIKKAVDAISGAFKEKTPEEKKAEEEKAKQNEYYISDNGTKIYRSNWSGDQTSWDRVKKEQDEKQKNKNNKKESSPTTDEALKGEANLLKNKASGETSMIETLVDNSLFKSILSSTIAIYKWRLRGSVGVMTGEATTPWHLTIGNPLSPTISTANVHVTSVELKLPNDFSYNDMPSKVDVIINVKLGRPLGAQELVQLFNNSYIRTYSSSAKAFKQRRN